MFTLKTITFLIFSSICGLSCKKDDTTAVNSPQQTAALCHSWTLVTKYANGNEFTELRELIANGEVEITTTFFTDGTLTIIVKEPDTTKTINSVWKWTNASQGMLSTEQSVQSSVVISENNLKYTQHLFPDIVEVYIKK